MVSYSPLGRKESDTTERLHLRIARRDKKAFLSDQCKEIEENNRIGKIRDLVKKIRDTKGTFHAKMGTIKCWEPAWGTPPVAKVMRKEAQHRQRWDRASGVPLEILEHLPPKPESAYFVLCALTYTSDFMGGCPPLPLSEKKKRVNLQLQLIIPGCDSVSTYKLLWKSSSLPE